MGELQEIPIAPPPGVVKNESARVIEGRWLDTINARFVARLPQKIGGWVKAYEEATEGVPRALHAWRDRDFNAYMAVGTYKKLYVYDTNLAQNDITPFRATGSLGANPFTVTNGSTEVIVEDTAHGGGVGDVVYYAGATAFNGVTIVGEYEISSVIDADHYTITIPAPPQTIGNDSLTKILLHMDGVNGGTTFTDSNIGGSAKTWTAGGTGVTSTTGPWAGTASLACGAGAGWVSTPSHADTQLGAGDWTVDFRFNRSGGDGTRRFMCGDADAASNGSQLVIELNTSNQVVAQVIDTALNGIIVSYPTAITTAGWHHVALVRSGNTLSIYVDGVAGTSAAITNAVRASANPFAVGRLGLFASLQWQGNIDEFRISKGVGAARWTAGFTPPLYPYAEAAGGGAGVTFQYEIPVGTELGAYGYGWGVGPWGLGTWGTARSSSTISIEPRVWSLDHWGVFLLAAYNGGSIYQFDPTVSQPWPRATIISVDPGLPTDVRAMFVTPERFVMALCDDMVVKWPSQGTLNDWTPTALNTANIRTLSEGTKLVGGRVLSDFVSLIWTDAALYRFQYTGATYVYSSSMVAKDCGLISPNAAVTIAAVAYWQGQDNFWEYTGTVVPMRNVEDIRDWVFNQLDVNLGYQCNASYNPKHNEVWFFFTIQGQSEPTLGVIYSIDQQCWAPLYWGRAGGTHYTQGDTRPYFGGNDFFIYQHEKTLNANGAALAYSWSLAPYGLTKGGRANYLVEYMVWDAKDQVGAVTLTVTSYDRLNDSVALETETETMAAVDSGTIDLRIAGRFVAITMGGNSSGCYARLGLPVAFIRPIGDRP